MAKRSIDMVVFGGGGYIGSAIVREGRKRGLTMIPLGRHVSEKEGHTADALEPEQYRDLLKEAKGIAVSIGTPPFPWPISRISNEQRILINGYANRIPIETAAEEGVENIVLVNAAMPSWLNSMVPGYYQGKMLARQTCEKLEADKAYSEKTKIHVLQPGAIYSNSRMDRAPGLLFGPLRFFLTSSVGISFSSFLINILPGVFKGLLDAPPVHVDDLSKQIIDAYLASASKA